MADAGGGITPVTRTPPAKQIKPTAQRGGRQPKREQSSLLDETLHEEIGDDSGERKGEGSQRPRKGRFVDERC